MREKEEKKKRDTLVEENRRQKSEDKHVRENECRLRGIDSCEAFVCSVLTFGMDHINIYQIQGDSGVSLLSLWVGKIEGDPKESGTCGGCY